MKIQRTIPPAAAPISPVSLLHGFAGVFLGKGYRRNLEKELKRHFGVKHVFLVSSGKAALAVILTALKSISPEKDEALIPAYTCYSVPSAIVKAGLKVSPCDINPANLDFDYGLFRKALHNKTLCVIPGHLFGVPSDMERIKELCRGKDIFIVEDAAQAMGGSGKGRLLGTIGDVGFFSLGRGKNITCGSGGIIVTNSGTIAEEIAKVYASIGEPAMAESVLELLKTVLLGLFIRPSLYWLPAGLPFLKLGETIFHKDFPVKRLSGVQAGLMRGWQERLEISGRTRTENAVFFQEKLGLRAGPAESLPFLRLPFLTKDKEAKEKLCSLSQVKGLGISRMYPAPVNEIREIQNRFQGKTFPAAKAVSECLLTLPTHHLLRKEDKASICGHVDRAAAFNKLNVPSRKGAPMKLIITIDTEEDGWGNYVPTGHALKNIRKVPGLQDIFDGFGVSPTYLVTHPVATDDFSISLLKGILDGGRCEIGSHCHPWNTPPFEEEPSEKTSMLCNLPSGLQYKKLKTLHDAIRQNLGVAPVSFRAGRWGYNKDVAGNLYRLGYKVDSSVISYTDWSNYQGPDFSGISAQPRKITIEGAAHMPAGHIWEVPATVGFLRKNFALSNYILNLARVRTFSHFRIAGILCRLNITQKAWLSPETSDSGTMIKLAKMVMKNNYPFMNVFFHSNSLQAGLTPFVRTKDDERKFLQRIREFLAFAGAEGIESIRLSDTAGYLQ